MGERNWAVCKMVHFRDICLEGTALVEKRDIVVVHHVVVTFRVCRSSNMGPLGLAQVRRWARKRLQVGVGKTVEVVPVDRRNTDVDLGHMEVGESIALVFVVRGPLGGKEARRRAGSYV